MNETFTEIQGVRLEQELAIRRALLRLRENTVEQVRLRELRDAISQQYMEKIDGLVMEAEYIKECVRVWIEDENEGKVIGFPDAGSAHLRQAKPKPEITDRAAFRDWALNEGLVKEVVDETRAKSTGGEMYVQTGILPPGLEWIDAHTTLVVREPEADDPTL